MTGSQRRMPAGKPFKKGDLRINRLGGVSKEKRAFKEEFDNAMAKRIDMNSLVEKLATLAEHGVEWAMREVLERMLGKVSQPVSGDLQVHGQVVFMMPRPVQVEKKK